MKKWVITCEHGGADVPAEYLNLFAQQKEILHTHRATDLGSKAAFNVLQDKADYALINSVTRLLIELNRSLHHPKLFSEFSRQLKSDEKQQLIDRYYLPYRHAIEKKIRSYLTGGYEVIHISVHTFTPALDGQTRQADIGLLYDPARREEKAFCRQWKQKTKFLLPEMKIRFNYPYLGKSDGFVTFLRKLFTEKYVGIELEINQKHERDIQNIASGLLKATPSC